MAALSANAALILIDVQQGFDAPGWGARNNPQAEDNIARLLVAWRASGRPVIHVRHDSQLPNSPLRPGQPGNAFKPVAEPQSGEAVIAKTVNSAFIGTGLEHRLRVAGIAQVVIAGLTTPHCVSTTARMAGNLGFDACVVSDATAAFALTGHDGTPVDAETVHAVALAELHGEFAAVVDTETVLKQLT